MRTLYTCIVVYIHYHLVVHSLTAKSVLRHIFLSSSKSKSSFCWWIVTAQMRRRHSFLTSKSADGLFRIFFCVTNHFLSHFQCLIFQARQSIIPDIRADLPDPALGTKRTYIEIKRLLGPNGSSQ